MSYWREKSAIITGGSAGLGLRLATALASERARVTLCGRSPVRLEAAADQLRGLGGEVLTIVADVAVAGETRRVVDRTVERFGGIDFACCCAGQSMRGALVETPRDRFQQLLEVNFLAALDMAQAAGPMLEARRGHLALIGSLASKVGSPHMGAYPASKFPLAALAQQLRLERGAQGLHVLFVCPGPIARDDATDRYHNESQSLPDSARKPGGGAKIKAIDPDVLSRLILRACERRKAELVVPRKARLLFALSQLFPVWGDWLLRKKTGN